MRETETPERLHQPSGLPRIAAGYAFADATSSLLALVGLWIVVRHLTVEEFGLADLLRTLQLLLVPLLSLNALMSVSRFYFDTPDQERRRRMLGGAIIVQFVAGVVGGGLLILCQPLAERFINANLTSTVVWLVALGLPPIAVMAALTQGAVLAGAARRYAGLTACQALLNLLAILVFVVWRQGGLAGYFVAVLTAATATALGGYLWQARALKLEWCREPLSVYVGFGGPYALAACIQSGYALLLRLTLVRLASAHALALYAVAERLQQPLTIATAAAGRAWVPWLFKASGQNGPRLAARELNGMVLLVLSALLLFLPELIVIFGGDRYTAAYPAALILFVGNWVYFVGDWIVSAGLFVSKQSYHTVWIYLIAYGGAAALALLMVPRLGSVGAAVGTAAAAAAILVAMALVGRVVWSVDLGLGQLLVTSTLGIGVVMAAGAWLPLSLKPFYFLGQLILLRFLRVLPLRFATYPA